MLIYALLLNRRFKQDIRTVSYLYLNGEDGSAGWQSIDVVQDQLEETTETTLTAYKTIMAEEQFAPRPNRFCAWCDFTELCDAPDLADWIRQRGHSEWDDI
jgi:CRISPR/Cas system-associated exonuclease Cas4 (RecB family)